MINLAWNRFSAEACQLLGHSLDGHESMEEVDVSHNFIDGASCMVRVSASMAFVGVACPLSDSCCLIRGPGACHLHRILPGATSAAVGW